MVLSGSTATTTGGHLDTLSTFTCFPKPPPEAREIVWEHASFLPRNVDIRKKVLGEIAYEQGPHELSKFITDTPQPAILQTNREARTVGLRHYTKSFGFKIEDDDGGRALYKDRIYINAEADCICPIGAFEEIELWRLQFQDIRHLAINIASSDLERPGDLKDFIDANDLETIILYSSNDGSSSTVRSAVFVDGVASRCRHYPCTECYHSQLLEWRHTIVDLSRLLGEWKNRIVRDFDEKLKLDQGYKEPYWVKRDRNWRAPVVRVTDMWKDGLPCR